MATGSVMGGRLLRIHDNGRLKIKSARRRRSSQYKLIPFSIFSLFSHFSFHFPPGVAGVIMFPRSGFNIHDEPPSHARARARNNLTVRK